MLAEMSLGNTRLIINGEQLLLLYIAIVIVAIDNPNSIRLLIRRIHMLSTILSAEDPGVKRQKKSLPSQSLPSSRLLPLSMYFKFSLFP